MSSMYQNSKKKFFTIRVTAAGFTDQIMQFVLFYKLGKFLQLNYLHQKLKRPRTHAQSWKQNEDIWEYLKFDELFTNQKNNFNDIKIVPTQIPQEAILSIENLKSFREEIHNYCRQFSVPTALEFSLPQNNERSRKRFRSNLTNLIKNNLSYFQVELDDLLPQLIGSSSIPACFTKNKNQLKVLIHIRRGDIGTILSPSSNQFLVTKPETNMQMNKIVRNVLTPESNILKYYIFMKELNQIYGQENICFLVFSDGFSHTYRKLQNILGLNNNEGKWIQYACDYQEDILKKILHFKNSLYFVGEQFNYLISLIESTMIADLIVAGENQRMTSKFLSFFGNQNKQQILVNLYQEKIPAKAFKPFLNQKNCDVIPINSNSMKLESLLQRIYQRFNFLNKENTFENSMANLILKMSLTAFKQGYLKQALDIAYQGIELFPNNKHFYYHIHNILAKQGKQKEAESAKQKAINLEDNLEEDLHAQYINFESNGIQYNSLPELRENLSKIDCKVQNIKNNKLPSSHAQLENIYRELKDK